MKNITHYYLVALCSIFLYGCGNSEEKKGIDLAKSALALQLVDPDSVQYKDLSYFDIKEKGIDALHEKVVCGFFNAKNAMGGYSGFSSFYFLYTIDQKGPLKSDLRLQPDSSHPAEVHDLYTKFFLRYCGPNNTQQSFLLNKKVS